ncbi:MAG: hypothetical protein H7A36_00060 [Chlamydiales bacterium]|nr:hypothetical protein [Chlamydiales bacterium]
MPASSDEAARLRASYPLTPDQLRFPSVPPKDEKLVWVRRNVLVEGVSAFGPKRVPPNDYPFNPPPGMAFVSVLRLVPDDLFSFCPFFSMNADGLPQPALPGAAVIYEPVVVPSDFNAHLV